LRLIAIKRQIKTKRTKCLPISLYAPFWHRRQVIMLRMIMEANYSFSSPEWDEISENAKDLVSFILNTFISSNNLIFHWVFILNE